MIFACTENKVSDRNILLSLSFRESQYSGSRKTSAIENAPAKNSARNFPPPRVRTARTKTSAIVRNAVSVKLGFSE